ncbi:MAG TPA: integrase arm-type DNA-binding domain-containing protein [Pseudorhizobium sp.]|nr:integrase arm-type DNA-binding domain-containing protein [Pseudorhizobium sp.]
MLSDAQIRKAKPAEKPYKLADGGGLHVFISPSGGKLWRLRYRLNGREQLLSLGPYPDVSLSTAREERTAVKAILREGRDPSLVRRQRRAATISDSQDTFETLAREWYELNRSTWTPTHASDVLRSLEKDVFPAIGVMPLKEITPPDVLALLRRIEQRPAIETARRTRQRISAAFVFGIAAGRCESDPAAIVKGALAPLSKGRQPAITDLPLASQIIRDVDASPAHPVTKLALRFLALTAVRPGAMLATPWAEFDEMNADEPVWRIPAERMKLRQHLKRDEARDHLIPLSRQAAETIDVIRTITGRGPLAFPNSRHAHRPMSENAIGYLLNRAGYHHRHVPHGWRSTFSTVMNERFPADHRIIDLMLAHTPKDRVEAAYNRAAHLGRRRELYQAWADMLMQEQRPPADLLILPRRTSRAA